MQVHARMKCTVISLLSESSESRRHPRRCLQRQDGKRDPGGDGEKNSRCQHHCLQIRAVRRWLEATALSADYFVCDVKYDDPGNLEYPIAYSGRTGETIMKINVLAFIHLIGLAL